MLSGHPLLPPLPATGSSSVAAKYWIRSADEPKLYHPEPVLDLASRMTLQGLGFGLLVSCVQNALQEHNKGAMGVFTRTGGTIAFFGALGAAFSTTRAVTANIRETNDGINGASGGCAAGFVAGLRGGSLPMAVGSCIFLGTMVGTFEAAGNSLTGYNAAGLDRNQKEARRAAFFKKEPIGQ